MKPGFAALSLEVCREARAHSAGPVSPKRRDL